MNRRLSLTPASSLKEPLTFNKAPLPFFTSVSVSLAGKIRSQVESVLPRLNW